MSAAPVDTSTGLAVWTKNQTTSDISLHSYGDHARVAVRCTFGLATYFLGVAWALARFLYTIVLNLIRYSVSLVLRTLGLGSVSIVGIVGTGPLLVVAVLAGAWYTGSFGAVWLEVKAGVVWAIKGIITGLVQPVWNEALATLRGPLEGFRRKRADAMKNTLGAEPDPIAFEKPKLYSERFHDLRPSDPASHIPRDGVDVPFQLRPDWLLGGSYDASLQRWKSSSVYSLKAAEAPVVRKERRDISTAETVDMNRLKRSGSGTSKGTGARAGALLFAGIGVGMSTAIDDSDTGQRDSGHKQARDRTKVDSAYMICATVDVSNLKLHVHDDLLKKLDRLGGLSSATMQVTEVEAILSSIGKYVHNTIQLGVERSQQWSGQGASKGSEATGTDSRTRHVGGAGGAGLPIGVAAGNVNWDSNSQARQDEIDTSRGINTSERTETRGGYHGDITDDKYRQSVMEKDWREIHTADQANTSMIDRLRLALCQQIEDHEGPGRVRPERVAVAFAASLLLSALQSYKAEIHGSAMKDLQACRSFYTSEKVNAARYIYEQIVRHSMKDVSLDLNTRTQLYRLGSGLLEVAQHIRNTRFNIDQADARPFLETSAAGIDCLNVAGYAGPNAESAAFASVRSNVQVVFVHFCDRHGNLGSQRPGWQRLLHSHIEEFQALKSAFKELHRKLATTPGVQSGEVDRAMQVLCLEDYGQPPQPSSRPQADPRGEACYEDAKEIFNAARKKQAAWNRGASGSEGPSFTSPREEDIARYKKQIDEYGVTVEELWQGYDAAPSYFDFEGISETVVQNLVNELQARVSRVTTHSVPAVRQHYEEVTSKLENWKRT